MDAIALLKKDHEEVKKIMEKLDETLPLHEFLQSLATLPAAQRRRILNERIRLAGKLVTTRRINLGMSQQNLADAVHCHVYTIGELEKDRIKVSVGLIERIKAALAWTD